VNLSDQSWPEVVEGSVVLVPLGSCEQHGPHLPLDTDICIAEHVARETALALAAQGRAVYVAPAMAYGASGEHQAFPGTLSIGTVALTASLCELSRSAWWASRIVFVNGHGGNLSALTKAVRIQRHEGRDVAWFACASAVADAHAGHTETSMMLSVAPGRVNMESAPVGETAPLQEIFALLVARGVRAVSPSGVLGNASSATEADGNRYLGALCDSLRLAIVEWRVDVDGRIDEGKAVRT
jgi:creatinine amidohydrolase